jgi:hypothetical protein
MRVRDAKRIAREWVMEQGSTIPGFNGAFFHGSVNWLPEDALLPPASDLDIMVVLADASPPLKPGKFVYRDVLLEVSYLSSDALQSPQQVLGEYNMAGSFHTPSVIMDPSGHLARLHAVVSAEYAKPRWVRARCRQARDKIVDGLARLDAAAPLHDQVFAWLFPTGVMTHVLLVAGLRNPTIRRRYAAARDLLADYGRLDFYSDLLELLGCAAMTRERAEAHLDALEEAFDAAVGVIRTPFFFASDISALSRPIAIDGGRELAASGQHREAIFWLAATYSRCMKVFYHDAPPEMLEAHSPGYRRLLRDLGIVSFADMQERGEQVRAMLPRLWAVAEEIMAANPEIEG